MEPVSQHFLFPFWGVLWQAVAVGANGVIRRNFLFCMGWAWRRWAGLMGFQAVFFGEGSLKPLQKNVATLFRYADRIQGFGKG